jgi:hypothetical protein
VIAIIELLLDNFGYNAPLCSAVDFKCNSHHAFEISSATQRSCITVHNDSTFSHLLIKLNGFRFIKLVRKDDLFLFFSSGKNLN